MRSLRVGALVPVCGCFHQLSTSSHASPSIHSTRPQSSIYCACLYGAQRRESGLIILCHILDTALTFNLSCVFVQGVTLQDFRLDVAAQRLSFVFLACYLNLFVFVGAQRGEMLIFVLLILTL